MLIKYFSLADAGELAGKGLPWREAEKRAIACWSRYYIDRDSLANQIKKLLGG